MIMLRLSGALVLLISLWKARALMQLISRMMIIFQRSGFGDFVMLLQQRASGHDSTSAYTNAHKH
jgi:hypothetical protein